MVHNHQHVICMCRQGARRAHLCKTKLSEKRLDQSGVGREFSYSIRQGKVHAPCTFAALTCQPDKTGKGWQCTYKDRTKNDEKLGSAPVGIVEEGALYLQRHLFHGWGDPHHHAKESVLRDGALRLMRQDCCGACGLR